MTAKKTTAKKAAKKAATKSAAPAAKKAAGASASKSTAPGTAEKKAETQGSAAAKAAAPANASTSLVSGERVRPINERNGFELKFDLYRGRHAYVGDDHVGWLAPNGLLVLRPEFAHIGFEDYVKTQSLRHHGRPIARIEYSNVRPVFSVEDSAVRTCPKHILDKADPALGDLDPEVIKWHRENLGTDEFARRYGDRIDIAKLGPIPVPGIPSTPPLDQVPASAVEGAQMSADQHQKMGENAPDTGLAPERPVNIEDLDDGRGEDQSDRTGDEDLDNEDIDNAGGGDADDDDFLDEDPPDTV